MIYVCKPITREYCQIAGNLAIRMNMNEHTAWLATLAFATPAFATLLIATLLLTTSDRDSFNCNGKNPRLLQPSPLQPWALQPCPLYPRPLATLPVATLRLETLLLAALALAKLPSGADSRQGCAFCTLPSESSLGVRIIRPYHTERGVQRLCSLEPGTLCIHAISV